MKKTFFLIMCTAVLGLPSCAQKKTTVPAKAEAKTATAVKSDTHTVKTLPAGVTADILQAIEKEYKGSVALIDVWATWCPPCRRAMTMVDSIKPDLMKKGVKFVYITGETSPLETWNEMIPKIHGDHYRLTKEQWKTLMNEQGIPGIPVYKVINKDGSTAFSNLTEGGYPGNDVIKPILEAAVKKK